MEIISEKYAIVIDTLKCKLYNYTSNGSNSLIDKRGRQNKIFSGEEEKIMSDHIKINYIDKNLPFDNTYLQLLAENFSKRHMMMK